MKLQSNVSSTKLPSLEEGQIIYKTLGEDVISDRTNNVYERCVRLIRVILYVELIVLLGWAGYIYLTKYYQDHKSPSSIDGSFNEVGWIQHPIGDDDRKATDSAGSSILPEPNDFTDLDYKDDPTDPEKTFLLDDRYANLKFQFDLSDLMDRYLSRQVRMTTEQKKEDSSSSSSSTTSEETTPTETKAKRSAESSSSESDSSDSSSEKDQATDDASKEKPDCPKMLDEDGNSIEDPADMLNYVRRNWLKSLLETPVPHCDKTEKTVTVDECGRFVIKCDDSDEDNGKEITIKNRRTRNVNVNDTVVENCIRVTNESGKILAKVQQNPIQKELSSVQQDKLSSLYLRMIAEQIIDGHLKTTEQFRKSIADIIPIWPGVTVHGKRFGAEELRILIDKAVMANTAIINIYSACHTRPDSGLIPWLVVYSLEPFIEDIKKERALKIKAR